MKLSRGSVTAVDGNELCQTLPDDLLERIIARVPFPFIFKARCLSKSWRARFFPISSQADDANECLAAPFQKQVGERSSNWESYGLMIVFQEDCLAYNRSSNSWRRMPSLSFAEDILSIRPSSHLDIAGALLYHYSDRYRGYVANILTRSWKLLPPCPNTDGHPFFVKLVTDASSKTYKVFWLCDQSKRTPILWSDRCSVEIYDSESDSWSCKQHFNLRRFMNSSGVANSAYFNGVLYLQAECGRPLLWAFNVEEDTFEELQLDCEEVPNRCSYLSLVVCNSDLLMIVYYKFEKMECLVLKVDLGSLKLLLLSRCPVIQNVVCLPRRPVSDGSYVFFGPDEGGQLLAYHVDDDEWSFVPLPARMTGEGHARIASSFRPGLCPFAAV